MVALFFTSTYVFTAPGEKITNRHASLFGRRERVIARREANLLIMNNRKQLKIRHTRESYFSLTPVSIVKCPRTV